MDRKAEKSIFRWIDDSENALLVSGARQVGKTYSIRKCLQQRKCNYLEINLIEDPELIQVLNNSNSVQDLVINLSAAKDYSFVKGETILFIDEVQEAKDIVTRIKFWVDEGSFRYVLSGSLLGIELKGLRSAPVGYLDEIEMFPLDFEEFLTVSGVVPETLSLLKDCFETCTPVPEIIHDRMLQHYRRYLVIGGMPAAVKEYLESGNVNEVAAIQRNIIELYKLDFTKYETENNKLRLIAIYDQIASQLQKKNRRYILSDIEKGLRFEQLESSFLWLAAAGVAIPVYNTTEPRVSLEQNKKSSLFKLYSSDVGLLSCQLGNSLRIKILMGDDKMNLGGIYENAVAQELLCHGFRTYYFNSKSQGELDFVTERAGGVVPIEVKSGKDYYVHSALNNVLANTEYEISEAYVFSNANISFEDNIFYCPVYMVGFLADDEPLPILERLER